MKGSRGTVRPLAKLRIGISISEGGDLRDRGFVAEDVNRIAVDVARRLIALGASVVLGHQWRPGGVMEAVAQFAYAYQAESESARVFNYLAWPDKPGLSSDERRRLKGLIEIREIGQDTFRPDWDDRRSAIFRMRSEMAKDCDARICLAGPLQSGDGQRSGVLEEALMMLERGKPVYCSRMMGGGAAQLIDHIRHNRSRDENPGPIERQFGAEFPRAVRMVERELAKVCGLSLDELEALFDAETADTVIYLATRGIRRDLGRERKR